MKEIIQHGIMYITYAMLIATFAFSMMTYYTVRERVNDVNNDGVLNLTDLSILATRIQQEPTDLMCH
jgi:dolichyl-phosphate-mannose--protein O-mannosyl transferase